MKLKTNLQPQTKKQTLGKILFAKSFNDKTKLYHHAIITFRQFDIADDKIAEYLGNKSGDFCKTTFNTVLKKIDESTDNGIKAVTGININCFLFIRNEISEDDLTFMQGKEKKNITIDELQYYLFRITKKVFEGGGYSSDARNYFTCEGFKKEFKTKTKRAIGKEKIAEMNKILNKYDWINIYRQKKTPNLYVMGEQNPFYYMEGIMEPDTISEIEQMIKDKGRFPVKLTQNDKELKELKQQAKKDKDTIAELNKQIKNLEKYTPDVEALQEEIDFLTERNQELLNENLKYQQQNGGNRCSMPNKPVMNEESIPEPEELSSEKSLCNAIESFGRMIKQYE